jgi:glycosyltransferase involved in cell wall biosynthesis
MKVIIVCSGNSGSISSFVKEQTESLEKYYNVRFHFFLIRGKGIYGYLKNIYGLRKLIKQINPDVIHAHYGLSGILANLQRKVPVITTFHGSDINDKSIRKFSRLAAILSNHIILVSPAFIGKLKIKRNFSVIPCGIDLNNFYPISKSEARQKLNLGINSKIILFAGASENKVKNFILAERAINLLDFKVQLIELKNFTREEVNLMLNGCDVALLTSFSEGSPQFIKEAMACNCPIVATEVGDIKLIFGNSDGCYLTQFDEVEIAGKIRMAFEFGNIKEKTRGRERIIELGLDSETIAGRILKVYNKVLKIEN